VATYADTRHACALDATGTFSALTVVVAGLPIRWLRGDIVIVVRRHKAAAGTIVALGAGLAVSVKHAGEGRS